MFYHRPFKVLSLNMLLHVRTWRFQYYVVCNFNIANEQSHFIYFQCCKKTHLWWALTCEDTDEPGHQFNVIKTSKILNIYSQGSIKNPYGQQMIYRCTDWSGPSLDMCHKNSFSCDMTHYLWIWWAKSWVSRCPGCLWFYKLFLLCGAFCSV